MLSYYEHAFLYLAQDDFMNIWVSEVYRSASIVTSLSCSWSGCSWSAGGYGSRADDLALVGSPLVCKSSCVVELKDPQQIQTDR